MSKKRSDFFAEMSGCPLAMRNGWLRQAVRADFRDGAGAGYDGDYDQPIVLVFYGGGETNLCNLHHRDLARHIAAHLFSRVFSSRRPPQGPRPARRRTRCPPGDPSPPRYPRRTLPPPHP